MAGVASLSTASGRHRLLIGCAPDVQRPPPYGPVLVAVRTVAQAASRACVGNINDATAALSLPDNPPRVGVRHRRSVPATRGHGKRQRLAPLSAQPQPVARRSTAYLLIKPFDRRQSQLPPRAPGPRSPATGAAATAPPRARSHAPPLPPALRQRLLRQRIAILDRCRRLAVRQPPRRGSRQQQRLLALVVRVVEHRDFGPLRRLARQERQRAARSRAYRAPAATNASSIPRLNRDGPLYVFPPESLHHRHDPTSSRQCSSAGPDPLRSFRRTPLAGPQEPVEPDSRNRTGLNAWAARARRG